MGVLTMEAITTILGISGCGMAAIVGLVYFGSFLFTVSGLGYIIFSFGRCTWAKVKGKTNTFSECLFGKCERTV